MQNDSQNNFSIATGRIPAMTAASASNAATCATGGAGSGCKRCGQCSSGASASPHGLPDLMQAEISKHRATKKETT